VKTIHLLWICSIALCLNACSSSPTPMPFPEPRPAVTPLPAATLATLPGAFPKIDRRPLLGSVGGGVKSFVPSYDPNSDEMWQVDLRSTYLVTLDLSDRLNDLLHADFDDQTVWPPTERMPPEFDPQRVMEMGKNPGLGIRELHAQGINGRGVGIAIVDQTLLVSHQEYANRLLLYEEINYNPEEPASMHGPAVASIAVGETVGVAPGADLYYIATWFSDSSEPGEFTPNFDFLAQAVRRILEINRQLPANRRIRVISIARGWSPGEKGYESITAAVAEAKAAGMLVVCSSIEAQAVHGLKFHGLGRGPLADPDQFESYEPGWFWAKAIPDDERLEDRLLVPMDSRAVASPTGEDEYVFYRQGGWSWAIPYIAGMYALAAQVDPAITPEGFWSLAIETGRIIQVNHEGQVIPLEPILDPAALVQALQEAK
jgi:hypothetical protein